MYVVHIKSRRQWPYKCLIIKDKFTIKMYEKTVFQQIKKLFIENWHLILPESYLELG